MVKVCNYYSITINQPTEVQFFLRHRLPPDHKGARLSYTIVYVRRSLVDGLDKQIIKNAYPDGRWNRCADCIAGFTTKVKAILGKNY